MENEGMDGSSNSKLKVEVSGLRNFVYVYLATAYVLHTHIYIYIMTCNIILKIPRCTFETKLMYSILLKLNYHMKYMMLRNLFWY